MKSNKVYLYTVGIVICFCVGVMAFTLYGLWQKQNPQDIVEEETGSPEALGKDKAVVLSIQTESRQIQFYSLQQRKKYTLSFSGTTYIYDKYGASMAISQLVPGEVVAVAFTPATKMATKISLAEDIWTYKDIVRFKIDARSKTMSIGEDTYQFGDDLVVASGDSLAELMDINEQDTLIVKGNGKQIYSIIIDKGHGYIRIVNDTYFTGGWIEIGQSIIKPVTEDMLIVVPEGTYDVVITNKGNKGTDTLTILRDEETLLDIEKIEIQEVEKGSIAFSIIPADAVLMIDGEEKPHEELVELEYGIHEMLLKADGYQTIRSNIKVGQALASIDIEMEKPEEDSASDNKAVLSENRISGVSDNSSELPTDFIDETMTSSDSTKEQITATGNRIHIDGPDGVEVYLDGTYMGVAPVNFKKTNGSHTITLRKNGYQTKSYTIQVEDNGEDMSWSFSDLIAE